MKKDLNELREQCKDQFKYLVLLGQHKKMTKDKLGEFFKEQGKALFPGHKSIVSLMSKASGAELSSLIPAYSILS